MSDRAQIADQLTSLLHAAEASVDDGLADTAQFVAGLAVLRREAGVAATVGQDVFASLNEAMSSLTQSRAALVAAHQRLEVIRRAMKIQSTGMVPVYDKPENDTPPPSGRLKVVAGVDARATPASVAA